MATDPYETLGVKRDADETAIRAAYRKLAKRFHPDLNPGKPEAAERFKQINAANDILSDSDKRARFDRGEIDAQGNETPRQPSWRDYADAPGRQKYRASGQEFDPADLEDILGAAFARGGARGRGFAMRGADAQYTLTIGFLDATNGTTRRVTPPDGRTLDVHIPPGVHDGHILRLKGQGYPGQGDAPAGDALVEVTVVPHPFFRRDSNDVVLDLPITVREAVLGAALEVPTIKGKVRLTIPPGSGTGTRLRLRGRGVNGGHQYVVLRVVLPPGEEPELAAFMKTWEPRHAVDPRAELEVE
ncbi:MAG: J domain-containing protein [Acetobacteraceae bacterium]